MHLVLIVSNNYCQIRMLIGRVSKPTKYQKTVHVRGKVS